MLLHMRESCVHTCKYTRARNCLWPCISGTTRLQSAWYEHKFLVTSSVSSGLPSAVVENPLFLCDVANGSVNRNRKMCKIRLRSKVQLQPWKSVSPTYPPPPHSLNSHIHEISTSQFYKLPQSKTTLCIVKCLCGCKHVRIVLCSGLAFFLLLVLHTVILETLQKSQLLR